MFWDYNIINIGISSNVELCVERVSKTTDAENENIQRMNEWLLFKFQVSCFKFQVPNVNASNFLAEKHLHTFFNAFDTRTNKNIQIFWANVF